MADPILVGYAVDVADKYGLPPSVFLNQINQESGFNQYNPSGDILTSWAGALGIAQILPRTAASPGYGVSPVDPSDPFASIDFMGQYDAAMLKRTGSTTGMLEAYNAGLGNLSGGAPYAKSILGSDFANGTVSAASVNGVPSVASAAGGRNGLTEWFTDPGQALKDAITGASGVTAAITGKTTNGVAPGAVGDAATGGVTSSINALTSKLFGASTWQAVAIAVLGIVLILGALFWLASSGRAMTIVQSASAA